MTHKLSSARAEMILSYHLLPQQIFFTHNWNLSRHYFVVVWLFVFCVGCFCLCLFFVLFLLLVLCVSVLVLWERDKGDRTMYRSFTSLLLRPLQLRPLRNYLINLICNMLGNMLNDLAEAIRRWTEKKILPRLKQNRIVPLEATV